MAASSILLSALVLTLSVGATSVAPDAPAEADPIVPSEGDQPSAGTEPPPAADDSAEAPAPSDAKPEPAEEPGGTETPPVDDPPATSSEADAGPDGNEPEAPQPGGETEPVVAEPPVTAEPTEPPSAAPSTSSPTASEPIDSGSSISPEGGRRKRSGLQRHRFVYKNLTAVRYNPLGLINEFTLGYRLQLIDKNTALFKESYLGLKAHGYVTPAFGRIGPMLEFQPLAILNLSATYDGIGYFGTFDLLQSFPSPRADYSDTALQRNGDDGLNRGTRGRLVTLSGLLQAKVGRIAVRDNAKFYYIDMALKTDSVTGREDPVSYSQTLDILLPDEGWAMTNDADLLYLFDFGLKLGARYTFTKAFYRDSDFLPGESTTDPNGPTHRVGPAVLYSPKNWSAKASARHNHSRKRWRVPTAILLLQWWAKHRFRTGQDVSAGVPYLVLGLVFEGDFFP